MGSFGRPLPPAWEGSSRGMLLAPLRATGFGSSAGRRLGSLNFPESHADGTSGVAAPYFFSSLSIPLINQAAPNSVGASYHEYRSSTTPALDATRT